MNAAISNTMAERIAELGGIAAQRIRLEPTPGTATLEDLARNNATHSPLCELIDSTLVEKAVGYKSSLVAIAIATILRSFVAPRKLGVISGADGMFRLIPGTTRGPDVAFISAARLPGGKIPSDAYPPIAPDLVVEVLSPGNTKAEMSRKRIDLEAEAAAVRQFDGAGGDVDCQLDVLPFKFARWTNASDEDVATAKDRTDGTVVRDMQGNTLFLFKNDFNLNYFLEHCPRVPLFKSNARLRGNMMKSAAAFFDE